MREQSRPSETLFARLTAMLLGRCPRCGVGAIFHPLFGPRMLSMHDACPVCGLPFLRESGYFLGAMYVSYTLGVVTVLPVAIGLLIGFDWSIAAVLGVALLQAVVSTPIFFRYSRTIWLHLDQAIDPR